MDADEEQDTEESFELVKSPELEIFNSESSKDQIQQSSEDDDSDDEEEAEGLISSRKEDYAILNLTQKIREIVRKLRASKAVQRYLNKEKHLKFVLDNATRWNSTYKMLKRFFHLYASGILRAFISSLSCVIPNLMDFKMSVSKMEGLSQLMREKLLIATNKRFEWALKPSSNQFIDLAALETYLDNAYKIYLEAPITESMELLKAAKRAMLNRLMISESAETKLVRPGVAFQEGGAAKASNLAKRKLQTRHTSLSFDMGLPNVDLNSKSLSNQLANQLCIQPGLEIPVSRNSPCFIMDHDQLASRRSFRGISLATRDVLLKTRRNMSKLTHNPNSLSFDGPSNLAALQNHYARGGYEKIKL
ncbi:hypothetical protein Ciccas_009388 [Cichlidogyrus casuarinus]|uniref:Uncharacterized protein n=1 Tax=Cichlidogyrus casuarinus TaxID=1844966 RepID=A0ABD2PYX7_9PLAT